MFESFRRPLAFAAASLLAAGAATAQTTFNPPLDAPTALSAPVYVELTPGAMGDCVTVARSNAGPEQRQSMRLTVDEAENGVRLQMIDQAANMTIGFVISDDGAVTLEEGSALDGMPPEMRAQFEGLLIDTMESTILHRRSVNQGDAIVEGEDLEKLLGPILIAMTDPNGTVTITGGQYVTGESLSNGRRALATSMTLEAAVPLPGGSGQMMMSGAGVGAFDVATGLQLYNFMELTVVLPPELGAPPISMEITMDCAITGG